ncbi:acyl-CoA dehydrogenase family protein [Piscinibacter koreensis]|uniref:Acyl-CoA dehydrogenase family protein n=1 Tax=Piscinibacter koreensis TaxID=2742824 RepID=A0A7Y6NN14_9BURK|nr:acyl-CoA dehydrogenase family protein [Schlegelella koreensis]NUZ06144.1 acyl-CoA dehydrogenase family protein [Schlegelella koreensis]
MNFELDDDQIQLHDSVRRLLADRGRFEQRRTAAASDAGFSSELWSGLAELGVTGLAVDEAYGGFARSAVDRMVVMQACGRALLLEPLLASAVLGATALQHAGDEAQRRTLLPGVAAGTRLLAWAHDEAGAHHAERRIATRARAEGGAWRLDGRKINVLHGAAASSLVVSARIDGAPGDTGGIALFIVDADAAGMQRRAHRLVDDTPAAEIAFDGAAAEPLGDPRDAGAADAALRATLAAGIGAACADMVGAMELAYELAVDYLNTRRQFGRPIGENQALRHKAAEMLVGLEMARSMAIAAAVALDDPAGDESARDLSRAKLVVGRHARLVCQHAVQIHGGIGMTEEYAVGHALRRVHVLDQLFGDVAAQARRLAAAA